MCTCSLELEWVGNGHQWYSPRYVHACSTPCNINSFGSTVLSIPLLNCLQKFLLWANQMRKLISNVNIKSNSCHIIITFNFIIIMDLNNNHVIMCLMLTLILILMYDHYIMWISNKNTTGYKLNNN